MSALTLTCFLTILAQLTYANCPTNLPLQVRGSGCGSTLQFTTFLEEDVCYWAPYDISSCNPSCCDGVDFDTCMSCTGAYSRTSTSNSFLISNGSLFYWQLTRMCEGNPLINYDEITGCLFNQVGICNRLYSDFRQAVGDSDCTGSGGGSTSGPTTGASTTTGGVEVTSTTSTSGTSSSNPNNPSRSGASSAAPQVAWLW